MASSLVEADLVVVRAQQEMVRMVAMEELEMIHFHSLIYRMRRQMVPVLHPILAQAVAVVVLEATDNLLKKFTVPMVVLAAADFYILFGQIVAVVAEQEPLDRKVRKEVPA